MKEKAIADNDCMESKNVNTNGENVVVSNQNHVHLFF